MADITYMLCGSPPTKLFHISGVKVIPNIGDTVRVNDKPEKYRVRLREIAHAYDENGYAHEHVTCFVTPSQ